MKLNKIFYIISLVDSAYWINSIEQTNYFQQDVIKGAYYETWTITSKMHCLANCGRSTMCIGALKTIDECKLVKRDPSVSVNINANDQYWKKDTLKITVFSEGKHEDAVINGWEHDFNADGMFVINDEIITVTYGRGINVLVYNVDNGGDAFHPCDNFAAGGVDAAAAEAALLTFYNSQPAGSIILVSVFDSAQPCGTDCQTVLSSIGGTGQQLANRDGMVIIGYKGLVCGVKPSWVTEKRNVYDGNDGKPVTATATITISGLNCGH